VAFLDIYSKGAREDLTGADKKDIREAIKAIRYALHRAQDESAYSREYVDFGLSIIILRTIDGESPAGSTSSPSNCQCG
jgi:hypothetical protein